MKKILKDDIAPQPVQIMVVLDESGSMLSVREATIKAVNAFIEAQSQLPGQAQVSLIKFSDVASLQYARVDLAKAPELRYIPNGMTALNDAIVLAHTQLVSWNPARAIVCIVTDGEENNSRASNELARQCVSAMRERGWEVVFLAANIDVERATKNYGFTRGVQFDASAKGLASMSVSMNAMATSYRTSPEPD